MHHERYERFFIATAHVSASDIWHVRNYPFRKSSRFGKVKKQVNLAGLQQQKNFYQTPESLPGTAFPLSHNSVSLIQSEKSILIQPDRINNIRVPDAWRFHKLWYDVRLCDNLLIIRKL